MDPSVIVVTRSRASRSRRRIRNVTCPVEGTNERTVELESKLSLASLTSIRIHTNGTSLVVLSFTRITAQARRMGGWFLFNKKVSIHRAVFDYVGFGIFLSLVFGFVLLVISCCNFACKMCVECFRWMDGDTDM